MRHSPNLCTKKSFSFCAREIVARQCWWNRPQIFQTLRRTYIFSKNQSQTLFMVASFSVWSRTYANLDPPREAKTFSEISTFFLVFVFVIYFPFLFVGRRSHKRKISVVLTPLNSYLSTFQDKYVLHLKRKFHIMDKWKMAIVSNKNLLTWEFNIFLFLNN